jgi:enolase-phosphatase E1
LTATLLSGNVRAILLDIEGTTSPVDFVYQVLFPYARSHVRYFLQHHGSSPEVQADMEALRKDLADVSGGFRPPVLLDENLQDGLEPLIAYVDWLIANDRKTTALKSLQGKIWEQGYRNGELQGEVFPDVPEAMRRWHRRDINISIFSSGSILAQKLLFAHTSWGDLTRHVSNYFDTTTGSKTSMGSYRQIQDRLGLAPSEIVFISDVTAELDVATSAGLQALLCERPGNRPQPANLYPAIQSFDQLSL